MKLLEFYIKHIAGNKDIKGIIQKFIETSQKDCISDELR